LAEPETVAAVVVNIVEMENTAQITDLNINSSIATAKERDKHFFTPPKKGLWRT
jgi:hypothetical protein